MAEKACACARARAQREKASIETVSLVNRRCRREIWSDCRAFCRRESVESWAGERLCGAGSSGGEEGMGRVDMAS